MTPMTPPPLLSSAICNSALIWMHHKQLVHFHTLSAEPGSISLPGSVGCVYTMASRGSLTCWISSPALQDSGHDVTPRAAGGPSQGPSWRTRRFIGRAASENLLLARTADRDSPGPLAREFRALFVSQRAKQHIGKRTGAKRKKKTSEAAQSDILSAVISGVTIRQLQPSEQEKP